ncbi:leukocyte receptor cluster member 9-like [Dreissena polymorpha]|uniref:RWD domain-containing protein n=1 Tax=Dreissena polymorpha TaxID=45954 RepID=A0A9D4GJM8_DREPO|nr:leukocyte receptor cluster member 9-like [Dreissena polymorpha]KAH3816270.1 hypothetical protein DPMN_117783 [Dreissena polymorpha]
MAGTNETASTQPTHDGVRTFSHMEEEISRLSANFKGQCKVIDTNGKFVKTVKLHPEGLDIVCNFKLTDSYPDVPPVVEIRSASLDEEELSDLKIFLQQTANAAKPCSLNLEGLVNEALEWLKNERINVTGAKANRKNVNMNINDKQKKARSKKNKHKDDVAKGKKPPMKTSMDVVKRILWDENLERDQFLVGYLDRIDGLKEKYFNAFSWEDIASVDYTVLAIPKHRIQYFKYKDTIVWDKRCRLDNVFGSTGSNTTIVEVIANLKAAHNVAAGGTGIYAEGSVNISNNVVNDDDHIDSDYGNSDDYSDSDSDSDDGITVTIGKTEGCAYGGNSYGGDEGEYGYDDDTGARAGPDDGDEEGTFDKYWRDKLRPNYFIALRITDDEIRGNAEAIQKQVIASESRLKECAIPRGAMHITLCTVGLDSGEQIMNAVKCLNEAKDELAGMVPKDKKLTFKGVKTFFNRVIYGRVLDCPPEFMSLVDHVKTCLTSSGIEIRDYHEFIPHMTIMKVSRPVAKLTGNNYIAPWLYSSFNETFLGSQTVDNLHLCSMVDDRQADGFYITATSLDLK